MYSQNLLSRARRLTDTEQAIIAVSKPVSRETLVPGTLASFSPVNNVSIAVPELLSCVSCRGGLDHTKQVNVGALKVSYSVHTHAGADPGGSTKDNQDAWCIQEHFCGQDMLLLGVFDGHGVEGRTVSNTICQQLPSILSKAMATKDPAGLGPALSAAFPEANRTLRHQPRVDAELSGSTGVVAVLAGSRLVVANLGDSRCVLGKVDGLGAVSAVALSSDHTPLDQQEAKRVLDAGGRIASFMCGSEPVGPPRVWLKEVNLPGLCMTRSFGDYLAATVGVIDQPQVTATPIKPPEDRYIVLMSDGIFEFLDSQQVLQEVHAAARAGQPPHKAAERLVHLARKCWQEQEDDIIDDCTCMVVYLSPAAAKHSPTASNSSSSKAAAGVAPATRLSLDSRIGSFRNGNSASLAHGFSAVENPHGPAGHSSIGRPAGSLAAAAGSNQVAATPTNPLRAHKHVLK